MWRFASLPKSELHAHLNGCIPAGAIRALLAERGVHEDPDLGVPPQVLEPVRGLEEYFVAWALLRSLPTDPAALEALVVAAGQELARDNVQYAELRNSITYIATANHVALDVATGWLLDAVDHASANTGVDLRLIACLTRESADVDEARRLLKALAVHADNARLVGVDLSGNEELPVPAQLAGFFRSAADDVGLGVTIHAGETGRTEHMWWALAECRADRIGHGLAAAEDEDLLEALASGDVCVEVCLTSNRLTGLVPDLATHPVLRFHDAGVPYVICSDNPQRHGLPLSAEYELLTEILGDDVAIDAMGQRQAAFAFSKRDED